MNLKLNPSVVTAAGVAVSACLRRGSQVNHDNFLCVATALTGSAENLRSVWALCLRTKQQGLTDYIWVVQ